jgi:hypothetical protein
MRACSKRATRARSAAGDAMSALRDLPPLEPDADHNLDPGSWRNGDAALGIADGPNHIGGGGIRSNGPHRVGLAKLNSAISGFSV